MNEIIGSEKALESAARLVTSDGGKDAIDERRVQATVSGTPPASDTTLAAAVATRSFTLTLNLQTGLDEEDTGEYEDLLTHMEARRKIQPR